MPASENGPGKTDKALGMDQNISRRDFLNSTLLASGGLLMTSVSPLQLLGDENEWTGYGAWATTALLTAIPKVESPPSHPRRRI
jgi:hypothetical protein